MSQLRELLAETVAGTGGCFVLTGPPGIGKTRLLTEAQEHAATLGLATAAGTAAEIDRVAPLSTLLSALRSAQPRFDLDWLHGQQVYRHWYVDRLGAAVEA